MERENPTPVELIELGSVSGDTEGNFGRHWELNGLRGTTGLSDD